MGIGYCRLYHGKPYYQRRRHVNKLARTQDILCNILYSLGFPVQYTINNECITTEKRQEYTSELLYQKLLLNGMLHSDCRVDVDGELASGTVCKI